MAHSNINERRIEVSRALENGSLCGKLRQEIAKKFECSVGAIYYDVLELTRAGGEVSIYPSAAVRAQIHERDRGFCQYCGTSAAVLIAEHVIPMSMFGHARPYNLVSACDSCNRRKGSRVWVPRNFDLLYAENPEWGEKILSLQVRDLR